MHQMVHCPLAVGLMLLFQGDVSDFLLGPPKADKGQKIQDLPRHITRAGEGEN